MTGAAAVLLAIVLAAGVAVVAGTVLYVLGLGVQSLRDHLREQDTPNRAGYSFVSNSLKLSDVFRSAWDRLRSHR